MPHSRMLAESAAHSGRAGIVAHWLARASWLPLFGLIFASSLKSTAVACETPVFRYAMYSPQWAPWPYVVFQLSDGGSDASSLVSDRLRAAIADRGANLGLEKINIGDPAAVERLPPAVKTFCRGTDKSPRFVVVNPGGHVVYAGELVDEDVEALVDSPARQQLGRLMSEGKIVLLLLAGKDAEETRAAERTVQELIRKVSDGQFDDVLLPRPPPNHDSEATAGKAALGPGDDSPAPSATWMIRSFSLPSRW